MTFGEEKLDLKKTGSHPGFFYQNPGIQNVCDSWQCFFTLENSFTQIEHFFTFETENLKKFRRKIKEKG